MLSPIVLFTYNRPAHTRRTLEDLKANELADQSELFIFCDGARAQAADEELEQVRQVREVAHADQWCGKVTVIESAENKGLAKSIMEGVTDIVNRFGKIIVLEDDISTSPGFLRFMNDALDFYEHEEKVMHISAYMFPLKMQLPETFFYNTASCWGWATWKRAWKHFNPDVEYLWKEINRGNRRFHFDVEGDNKDFSWQLENNVKGNIRTWAVRWYASIFLHGGLCLHPGQSLVQNMGLDGSGVNCPPTNYYHIPQLADRVEVKPIPLEESADIRAAMRTFYRNRPKRPLSVRLKKHWNNLVRMLGMGG